MAHFSAFFRWMEEAEHAVWRRAGLNIAQNHRPSPAGSGRDGSFSWPRISARFDFKAPLRFQDEFEVHTEIGAVTRSTIQWAHALMRGDVVIGNGTVTAVCVKTNPDDSKESAAIPGDVLARLRSAVSF